MFHIDEFQLERERNDATTDLRRYVELHYPEKHAASDEQQLTYQELLAKLIETIDALDDWRLTNTPHHYSPMDKT